MGPRRQPEGEQRATHIPTGQILGRGIAGPIDSATSPRAHRELRSGGPVRWRILHRPLGLRHRNRLVLEALEVAPLDADFDAGGPSSTNYAAFFRQTRRTSSSAPTPAESTAQKTRAKNSHSDWVVTSFPTLIHASWARCTTLTESELQEAIDQVPEYFREFIPL